MSRLLLPRYGFDQQKARALLDAAGWRVVGPDGIREKDGRKLQLVAANVSGSSNGSAVFVSLQRDWHDVGVDLEIKNYITSLFFSAYTAGGILMAGKFDIALDSWVNGEDPDDSTQFMCNQMPPAGQNIYHFCDETLDAAEQVALNNYDIGVRKRAYAAIQYRLVDREPLMVLWFARRIDLFNTDLQGFRPAHTVTDLWNSWAWSI